MTTSPENAGTPTILVVDDESWNLMLVETVLDDTGYRILTAQSGDQALDLVAGETPDAILLDIMMPGMDGYEVCRRLKSSRRTFFVPIVMLTALADTDSRVRGLEAGADDFLTKPINRIELLTRLRALLRIRALRDELDSTENVLHSMVAALEAKDPSTRGHSLRVAALVKGVVDKLRLGGPDLESLIRAALLHDIGKIGVPDEVLETPASERTLDAHRLYQLHPLYSVRILESLASLRLALPIIRHHHERLDGSGYPDGLSGSAITPPMQVVAAANAFEGFRMASPEASPETWAAQLRAEVAVGKFHAGLAEGVIQAERELPEVLPEIVDLLPSPSPATSGEIFVADDSAAHREIYQEILTDLGLRVRTFADGAALLAAVHEQPPDLVITDVRMPALGGEELCRLLKSDSRYEYLPLILVSAHMEAASKERALASGADDFLSVPVDRQELMARVRSLLRLSAYRGDLERAESVVLSLAGVLEARDPATSGHSSRVAELARRLAVAMELPEETQGNLETAGLLHDIGKVAIPERVLHATDPPPGDLDLLRTHPTLGHQICRNLRSTRAALPAILHHHERADGSGYPEGLAGAAIPLSARVLGLANAFDHLTVRDRLSIADAVERLGQETEAGRWDAEVYRNLEKLYREGEIGGERTVDAASEAE